MSVQGITQESLAPLLGVQPATVSHYFTGRREPDIDQLIRLAKRLGVTVSHLTGELPLAESHQESQEVAQLIEAVSEADKPLLLDLLRAAAARAKID
jgi:transcriptional regulator with XRE-family HTH domain